MFKLILTILSVFTVGAAGVSVVVAREIQSGDPLRLTARQEVQPLVEVQTQEQTRSQQTGPGLMLQEQVMNQAQFQTMGRNEIGNQLQGQLHARTAEIPTCDQDRPRLQLYTADKLQDRIRLQDWDRINQSKP